MLFTISQSEMLFERIKCAQYCTLFGCEGRKEHWKKGKKMYFHYFKYVCSEEKKTVKKTCQACSKYGWIGVTSCFELAVINWMVSDNEVVGGYWINLLNVNNIVIYRSNTSTSQLQVYYCLIGKTDANIINP